MSSNCSFAYLARLISIRITSLGALVEHVKVYSDMRATLQRQQAITSPASDKL